jgi:pyrroline-5-carboxylate reductase
MTNVIVVIGTGSIGQAVARRVSAGKHVLLADLREENANTAAKTLSDAGFEVTSTTVDVSSRASIQALVERPPPSVRFLASSMPPAFRHPRHRRKRSLRLICMEPRLCWRSSETLLHAAAPAL